MFAKEKRDYYSVNHEVAVQTQQKSPIRASEVIGGQRTVQADYFFYPRTPKLKSSKFQELI